MAGGGYEWSPWREESQAPLKLGLLPEIHVCAGLPGQKELLDFAMKFLPEQAANEGLAWRTTQPRGPGAFKCAWASFQPERDQKLLRHLLNPT